MRRFPAARLIVVVVAFLSVAASPRDAFVRVALKERVVPPGAREAVLSVYASPDGETPIATATRPIHADANGAFKTTLGSLASATAGSEERWLSVRVPPGVESRRFRLAAGMPGGVTVHVVTDAAISANGFVESVAQGFRFPDGSVQTSAAQVSGGVPSVNSIGSAVTIAGAGTASVGTAGSTITVTGTGLSGVTAGNGLTGGGSSGSPTVSASYGSPVAVGAANADGSATTLARSDHVHAHGDQAGGSLHSAATTGTAGFMSAADKTKLNGTFAYVRTIIVGPALINSTSAANGAALIAALNGISGNSSTAPFLLKIEPGVYDIGATALTMKTYVDIEGSGENATFITATRGSGTLASASAVIGAANAELRNLTVSNTSSSTNGIGYYVTNAAGARLRDVTINSTGGTTLSYGVFATTNVGLTASRVTVTATSPGGASGATGFGCSSSTTLSILDSTITAKATTGTGTNTGFAASSSGCVATIDSTTILGTGVAANTNVGVNVAPGNVTITNSTVEVDTANSRVAVQTSNSGSSILHVMHSRLLASGGANSSLLSVSKGSGSTVRIAASQIDSQSIGVPKCVHVYDGVMEDLNNVCPAPIL